MGSETPLLVLRTLGWALLNLVVLHCAAAWVKVAFPVARGEGSRVLELGTAWLWAVLALSTAACAGGTYRLPVLLAAAAVLFVATGLAVGRPRVLESPWTMLGDGLRELLAPMRRVEALLLVLVGLPAAVYLVRAVGAPPRAWDTLTYHLFKAGLWIQDGGFRAHPAPGAWSYYAFFPPGGDLLWSWFMLPVQGDGLLWLAYLGVHLLLGVACYALARTLGASPARALLAAALIWVTPAVVHYAASAYVDTLFLLLVVLGCLFSARAGLCDDGRSNLTWAAMAFGMAALVKTTGYPLLVAFAGYGAWLVLRRRVRPGALAAALLPAAVALVPLAHAWRQTGSPVFPFELVVGGMRFFEGDPLFLRTHDGTLLSRAPQLDFLPRLFFGTLWPDWPHLNLGIGALVVAPAGVVAGLAAARRAPAVWALLFAVALVPILGIYSDAMAAQRTYWSPVSGRFLTPSLAVCAVALAAGPGGRSIAAILAAAIAAQLWYAVPRGVVGEEFQWALPSLAAVAALVLGVLAVLRIARAPRARLAGGLAAFFAAPALFAVAQDALRHRHRYDYYRVATTWRAYDVHPVLLPADAWEAWAFLDREDPLRIAFSTGFDGVGHNWFRYPLLGARLQNRVLYVPPTRDGRTLGSLTPQADVDRALDRDAYLLRLRAEGVDYVVFAKPAPPEAHWVLGDPTHFEPALITTFDKMVVFAVKRP